MFKRLYAQKLTFGDKTAIAYHTGTSQEYVSKLTRYGGEPCPAERYWKWICAIEQVNPAAADALHESINAHVAELRRHHQHEEWCPRKVAAALVKQAAETVATLIETDCGSDDEPALLDLKLMVEVAIEKCRTMQGMVS